MIRTRSCLPQAGSIRLKRLPFFALRRVFRDSNNKRLITLPVWIVTNRCVFLKQGKHQTAGRGGPLRQGGDLTQTDNRRRGWGLGRTLHRNPKRPLHLGGSGPLRQGEQLATKVSWVDGRQGWRHRDLSKMVLICRRPMVGRVKLRVGGRLCDHLHQLPHLLIADINAVQPHPEDCFG